MFLLLILVLFLGVYFLSGFEESKINLNVADNLEPIIVKGNSYVLDDGYVDPLDREIGELEYNDQSQDSGSGEKVIECAVSTDCAVDYVEETYCIGDRVYQKLHSFSCDGQCSEEVDRVLVEDCLISCSDGQCLNSYPYDCVENYDCNFDDFVGDAYCLPDDNAHQYYATWICLNPGSLNSMCYVELVERLVEECGVSLTCEAGMCIGE